jgi:predicted RNase H-like HicB family nuclease
VGKPIYLVPKLWRQGQTLDEVVQNLREAIELHLQDEKLSEIL